MDGSTIMRNLEEQMFGVRASCINGSFVQGAIWCKILRLTNSEVLVHKNIPENMCGNTRNTSVDLLWFLLLMYWEELDEIEYVADLIAFGSYFFFKFNFN